MKKAGTSTTSVLGGIIRALGVAALAAASAPGASGQDAAAAAGADAAGRPNFLVILCDDLGNGDLGCYGHPHIRTPNLDRLASEGVRFTDCYAAAPVCSPSRAGLLTGRIPSRFGVHDWIPPGHPAHLPESETTIAELLGAAGYDTAIVGKWHLNGRFNSPEQPQPDDHGFGHWMATQNNAAPRHENPTNFVRNGEHVGALEGFSCQLVADEAIRWLEGREDPARPFFLHVCFHEPHEPVESPPERVARYREVARNEDEAQYFANVENVDDAVGRLVAAVDGAGLAARTLVFFTSDNGPETLDRYPRANRSYGSPGPLRGMKLHVHEGGIRVPGIARWTGTVPAGRESRLPIGALDLLPTFCELAGVAVPDGLRLDGTSLAPLLRREPLGRRQPLFWFYYRALSDPRVAVRDGDWKLTASWDAPLMREAADSPGGRNVNRESQRLFKSAALRDFQLFHVGADPGESRDLSEKNRDDFERLRAAAIAIFESVRDESPVWDTEAWESR